MKIVGREMLEALSAALPSLTPRGDLYLARNRRKEFDLEQWISKHGIQVRREGPWKGKGYKYVLEECPWKRHTDNAGYIVRFADGAIAAGCQHNSCQGYGWRDLREHYEPGAYEQRNGVVSELLHNPPNPDAVRVFLSYQMSRQR